MTKSRERPIAGASRRSRRAQREWKVEIHIFRTVGLQQRRHARPHLFGGLVGEGDGEDAIGRRQAGRDDVSDPMRDDTRLPRTGAGQNEHGAIGVQHSLALLGIES